MPGEELDDMLEAAATLAPAGIPAVYTRLGENVADPAEADGLLTRIHAELARLPGGTSPADAARANLRAIGTAYLRFAQEETGLFHTAFAIPDQTRGEPIPAKAGNSGLNPFQLLGAALDRLVDAGVLPPERRPGAE